MDEKKSIPLPEEIPSGKKKKKAVIYDPTARDEKGIQTLFRTLSKNHYTLLETIDRKSSIILTVNSILISLAMGAVMIEGVGADEMHKMPQVMVIMMSALISMVFAVLAIIPHRTQGNNLNDNRGLLYEGNFTRIPLEEFEGKMSRLMENGEMLYSAMIRDIYFLGIVIEHKKRKINMALLTFISGLLISTVWYFVDANM